MGTFDVARVLHLFDYFDWGECSLTAEEVFRFVESGGWVPFEAWIWRSGKSFAGWAPWNLVKFKESFVSLSDEDVVDSVHGFLKKCFFFYDLFLAGFVLYFNQLVVD